MNKEETILIITEGEKLDINILNRTRTLFLPNQNIKIFPICLNIYNLYQEILKITEGTFTSEFIDTLRVIKEISQKQRQSNNEELANLNKNDVSSIFLFFDYDGHDTLVKKHPNCVQDMLTFFNSEEQGKLYINYPMVECYKHPIKDDVEIIDIFTKKHYKTTVASICNKKFENINKLSKSDWLSLFLPHLKSTSHLLSQGFILPKNYTNMQSISQLKIYEKQFEKYINPEKKVMVFSSFSLFLLEYLGEKLFLEWQSLDKND